MNLSREGLADQCQRHDARQSTEEQKRQRLDTRRVPRLACGGEVVGTEEHLRSTVRDPIDAGLERGRRRRQVVQPESETESAEQRNAGSVLLEERGCEEPGVGSG